MATDVARLALAIDVTGAKRAQSAMEAIRSGSVRLTRATDEQIAAQRRLTSTYNSGGAAMGRFSGRLRGLGRGFRVQKGSTAQFGQQLQDITIQAQMGTSAFTILAQQGGQVASLFGPGGALLGAIVAIGGALGGAYFASTTRAAESTKTLTERIGELRDNVDELTQAQIEGLKVEFFQANRERAKAINSEKENIRDLTEELIQLQNAERAAEEQGNAAVLGDLREEIKETSGDLKIARGALQTFLNEADSDAQKLDELINGTDETGNSAEDAAEKIREMVEAAEQQAITIGLSARATATYEAAIAGATAEQILAIDTAYRRIEAEQEKQDSLKETERREIALRKAMMASTQITVGDDPLLQRMEAQRRGMQLISEESEFWAQRMVENQRQISSSLMATMANTFGTLQTFTEKGTAEWAAMVAAQKGIMAAQAFMAANLAATLALASPMAGPAPAAVIAQAETMRQIGYVNAGLILAQGVGEIATSFDGGGFTGNGPRSGGLDGKGGFMAMMHPQETVIDHTKGQGMGGDVNVIINNAPPGTRTEERTDNQGRRFVEVFIADMTSGGPMWKTLSAVGGLRRQGR